MQEKEGRGRGDVRLATASPRTQAGRLSVGGFDVRGFRLRTVSSDAKASARQDGATGDG